MVVKSDGTKWACQSCLKGHRVSGCTHTDRELTLVPKKGRPITQCQHCRQERKKRSAHVKCDCGEVEKPHHSKEKCIHLREAEGRTKAGIVTDQFEETGPDHVAAIAAEQGCCCHHGGKCTCSTLKKESAEGTDNALPHGPAVKPRLEATKSDGSITVFQNGHHKPVHRKNHAAHECGLPYKVPMPRCKTDTAVAKAAWRSVDSLALDSSTTFNPSTSIPQPTTPFTTERRLSKSEQPSPEMDVSEGYPSFDSTKFPSVDFTAGASSQSQQSLQSANSDTFGLPFLEPTSGVDGYFDQWPAPTSTDSTSMPNNNPFGVWPTTIDGSGLAQPALTAASSGTQSEVDEIPPVDDVYGFSMPSIQEDACSFNWDGSLSQAASQGATQSNRHSLPPNFLSSIFKVPDMAMSASDWQPSNMEVGSTSDGWAEQSHDGQSMGYEDIWQTQPDMNVSNIPLRSIDSLAGSGRPAAQSIAHATAPDDEIIQQLFPDFDSNMFSSSSSPHDYTSSADKSGGLASTSAPFTSMATGAPAESVGFTSHPWSDGSINVPNDSSSSSYDLNDEFADPDFAADWAQ